MASKVNLAKSAPLIIGLGDPGITPLLRAGLGGLAASLRSVLLKRDPEAKWPAPVPIGGGEARVDPNRITIDWKDTAPEDVLAALFRESFQVRSPPGLIDLPGARSPARPLDLALASVLQTGLKKTFLQHGKTTVKAGGPTTVAVDIDGQQLPVTIQPYSGFIHQTDGLAAVCEALARGSVDLAGWAYPGAADRHTGLSGATKCSYNPGAALCACFALIGCLSFDVPKSGGAGALVIVEPEDLVRFAVTRPRLTPRRVADAYVTGPGDAVLSVHLAMRLDDALRAGPGVAAAHGVSLRTLPWSTQQKTRASTLSVASIEPERLDLYHDVVRTLPNRIVTWPLEDGDEADGAAGFFAATSALRGFVAENIAAGRRWFAGFARATTSGKKPRFIHYYRAKDQKNLGALYPNEREGLMAMLKHLEEAEGVLVRAVHVALRQRFGAIADESKDVPQTMKNRWSAERERWRLSFVGAKTPQQIRAALADLWSRAGANRELKAHWEVVLPLLRADHWETARDLALVALASYRSAAADDDEPEATEATN